MSISGRENNIYQCYDRLTRAKIAMVGLLEGDVDRGISKLSDDKVIGLSVFPAYLVSTKKMMIMLTKQQQSSYLPIA